MFNFFFFHPGYVELLCGLYAAIVSLITAPCWAVVALVTVGLHDAASKLLPETESVEPVHAGHFVGWLSAQSTDVIGTSSV